jgi:hypothetical protein
MSWESNSDGKSKASACSRRLVVARSEERIHLLVLETLLHRSVVFPAITCAYRESLIFVVAQWEHAFFALAQGQEHHRSMSENRVPSL